MKCNLKLHTDLNGWNYLRIDLIADLSPEDGSVVLGIVTDLEIEEKNTRFVEAVEIGINKCFDKFAQIIMEKLMAEKCIGKMHLKKSALRKELGAKPGKKIPAKKLKKAAHSKNPTLKKRVVLAETFKKMKK